MTDRYPEITFNPYAATFICPRCRDVCNCTKCAADRSEPYISVRVGRLPLAGSMEARVLAEEALEFDTTGKVLRLPKALTGDVNADGEDGAFEPPALDLAAGAFFGVVYDLHGRRIGTGYVGEDSREITLRDVPAPKKEARAKKTVKGKRGRGRKKAPEKALEYIGVRRRKGGRQPQPAAPPAKDVASLTPPGEQLSEGAALEQLISTDLFLDLAYPDDSSTALPSADERDRLRPLPPENGAPHNPWAQQHLTEKTPAPAPPPPPRRLRRMYIGDRSVLDSRAYVPIDDLIEQRRLDDELEDWPGPPSDAAEPAAATIEKASVDEMQCAIALALQAIYQDSQGVAAAQPVVAVGTGQEAS